uniref:Uncharacterized protein n=1 Tax=Sinocyclocheilus grahami TaxID=75366 RepID=A0A672RQ58_SINGR
MHQSQKQNKKKTLQLENAKKYIYILYTVLLRHLCCFAASRSGYFALIEVTRNYKMYQDISLENVETAVHDFRLYRGLVMQQENDSKNVFLSPELKTTVMLWHELKKAVLLRQPGPDYP